MNGWKSLRNFFFPFILVGRACVCLCGIQWKGTYHTTKYSIKRIVARSNAMAFGNVQGMRWLTQIFFFFFRSFIFTIHQYVQCHRLSSAVRLLLNVYFYEQKEKMQNMISFMSQVMHFNWFRYGIMALRKCTNKQRDTQKRYWTLLMENNRFEALIYHFQRNKTFINFFFLIFNLIISFLLDYIHV